MEQGLNKGIPGAPLWPHSDPGSGGMCNSIEGFEMCEYDQR